MSPQRRQPPAVHRRSLRATGRAMRGAETSRSCDATPLQRRSAPWEGRTLHESETGRWNRSASTLQTKTCPPPRRPRPRPPGEASPAWPPTSTGASPAPEERPRTLSSERMSSLPRKPGERAAWAASVSAGTANTWPPLVGRAAEQTGARPARPLRSQLPTRRPPQTLPRRSLRTPPATLLLATWLSLLSGLARDGRSWEVARAAQFTLSCAGLTRSDRSDSAYSPIGARRIALEGSHRELLQRICLPSDSSPNTFPPGILDLLPRRT